MQMYTVTCTGEVPCLHQDLRRRDGGPDQAVLRATRTRGKQQQLRTDSDFLGAYGSESLLIHD